MATHGTFTVPMRIDIRYGTTREDGSFRESLASVVDRTIGFGARRAFVLASAFIAGLVTGALL